MHREHLIEQAGRNELIMRTDELDAHDRRFDPADHKKNQA